MRLPEPSLDASSTQGIDRLFSRFAAIYGAKFSLQWAGVDPNEMKRAWVEQLQKFTQEQITKAIDSCSREVKFPPTLPEFVELCRSFYETRQAVQIEDKRQPFIPQRSKIELQVITEIPKPAHGKGTWWAKRIIRLAELGEPPPFASIEKAKAALGFEVSKE